MDFAFLLDDASNLFSIGYSVSDPMLLLIIISTVCAGLAVRRQRQDGSLRGTALVMTVIMLVAAFVAVWAMSTKPT